MLSGVKGGLEEGGAQGFHPALAHPGLAFPLAAFLEPWVVAHEGLEPGGHFAIGAAMEDLERKVRQNFSRDRRTEAGDGFHQSFGFWIDRLASEDLNLSIQTTQARFHRVQGLEDGLQGWGAGRTELGIGDGVSCQRF